jgi:hypothetical protein
MAMTLPICGADKRRKPDICGAATMLRRRCDAAAPLR